MRRRLGVAAVMADQRAAKTMLDQPGRALRAFDAVPAGAAERERRIAAAIEEQQGLFARGQCLLHRLDDRRRQPAAAGRWLAPEIDRRQLRQLLAAVTGRQMQRAVAGRRDVDDALERGCRRGQHDRCGDQPRPHDGHVARVVGDALVLLEGTVVLLVDHDQAQGAERQEQRRACADHDSHPALGDGAPGLAAFQAGKTGMPGRGRRAETVLEAFQPLRGERDFGQQHQHLPA